MSLSADLAASTGTYFGTGGGIESGPFVSRIDVALLPNGGVAIDYEATSIDEGVLHREHSMLVAGPDGRDRLFVAHSESPFVTEMVETEPESGRFAQREPFGPYVMEIVIEVPEPGRMTYAWWWGADGNAPVEQSKADATRQQPKALTGVEKARDRAGSRAFRPGRPRRWFVDRRVDRGRWCRGSDRSLRRCNHLQDRSRRVGP